MTAAPNKRQGTRHKLYQDPVIAALLQAANDSARLFRVVFVVFLTLILYFLAIAFSVNDELLFKDGDLQAPILNVGIRTSTYFMLMPVILLLLHLNLLIQGVFLVRKVEDYRRQISPSYRKEEMLRLLFPIPMTQMSGGDSYSWTFLQLLIFIAFGSMVILPIATLGVVQIIFLSFQNDWITGMHTLVLLIDFLLIGYLWPKIRALYSRMEGLGASKKHDWWWVLIPVFVLWVCVFITYFSRPSGTIAFCKSEQETVESVQEIIKSLQEAVKSLQEAVKSEQEAAESVQKAIKSEQEAAESVQKAIKSVQEAAESVQKAIKSVQDTVIGWLQSKHTLDVRQKRLYLKSETTDPEQACKDKTLALNLADSERSYRYADLSGAFLCNADLGVVRLEGACLKKTRLQGADLRAARLQGANLMAARLQGANLMAAQLQGANLWKAELQGADLRAAQLQRAKLWKARLQGADLGGAQLQGADLWEAELQGADLMAAQLQGADLRAARLQGANLRAARLQGAKLWKARLQGADLGAAQLQGADLGAAQLQGAKLSATGLQGAALGRAQLQGVSVKAWRTVLRTFKERHITFKERIKKRTEKYSNVSKIILRGGITKDDINEIIKKMLEGGVSENLISSFNEAMEPHIGEEEKFATEKTITSEPHNATVGRYTQEDARQWIGKYMNTMCEAFLPLDQEFVLELHSRIGISENTIRGWYRDGHCPPAPNPRQNKSAPASIKQPP